MEYFAGLDVSMAETQVCVMDRDGAVIHEVKVPSTPAGIAAALAQAPACKRIVSRDRSHGADAVLRDDDYGGRLTTTTLAGWGSLRLR